MKIVSKVCVGDVNAEKTGHICADDMIAFICSKSAPIKDKMREPGNTPKTWEFRKGEFVFYYTLTEDLNTIISVERITSSNMFFNDTFVKSMFPDPRGYVYFLESEYGFKIGMSIDIKRRIKELSVKLPFPVSLHSYCKLDNYKELEKSLHELMSNKQINGEWFHISESDWELIDSEIAKYNTRRFFELETEFMF